MRAWRIRDVVTLFSHRIFRLERHFLEAEAERREAMVLRAPDWVNVIALDEDERVLLVRQWRFGIAAETLEIPGGMIDEGESDRAAAERELYEETGHRAAAWHRLGDVHPNPAFLGNRCTTWVARGLERIGEPAGDGEEEIVLERAPLRDVPGLVARGEITHALVVAAFYLLAQSPQSPPR
jgi:8-oxo-dGTP pyrophosphatase MutT (NUDIX family)